MTARTRTGATHRDRNIDGAARLWLYGLHAVDAALRNPERRKFRMIATRNGAGRLQDAIRIAQLDPELADGKKFKPPLPPDCVHQGVALEALALQPPHLDTVCDSAASSCMIVLLDRITDPRNVGAIMRTASAFGAVAVIATRRHGPSECATLAKAASGAMDRIPYLRVVNLTAAMNTLQNAGFYLVGLDSGIGADLSDALSTKTTERLALVIGAEGQGLRRLTKERCDKLARIRLKGPDRTLNASNAAAIALFAATHFD